MSMRTTTPSSTWRCPTRMRFHRAATALLNGRLSLQSGDDKWDVGVWGRNIADRFYLDECRRRAGLRLRLSPRRHPAYVSASMRTTISSARHGPTQRMHPTAEASQPSFVSGTSDRPLLYRTVDGVLQGRRRAMPGRDSRSWCPSQSVRLTLRGVRPRGRADRARAAWAAASSPGSASASGRRIAPNGC